MRRRSATTSSASFSLFPFLAVLLCVMGALIVVLVVIARQARQRGTDAAKARAAELATSGEQRAAELASLRWRSDQLRESRDKTAAQLEQQRLELSHIEEHARALRDQLADLEKASDQLDKTGDNHTHARLQAELAALSARSAAAEAELEKSRRAAADASSPSYAIVPFEGPNQTRRRPLYIECRADDIVLQPEGIVLTEQDFLGPLGPGNPLAAALRAAREYLMRNQRSNRRESGEPYPLLLVRPDGIGAYYAAREAMSSWGSDFGYELIEQDWKLDFNPPDDELAAATRVAVEEARLRQHQLALAAPRRYGEGERQLFRASPTRGGVVREGRIQSHGLATVESFGRRRGGRFTESRGGSRATGNARAGAAERNGGVGPGGDDAALAGPYDSLLDGNSDKPAASGGERAATAALGQHTSEPISGKALRGSPGAINGTGNTTRAADRNEPPTVPLGSEPSDFGDAKEGSGTEASQAKSGAGGVGAGRPGGERSSAGASASGSSQLGSTVDPNNSAATPSPEFTFGPTAKKSLAERRGKNWGLPDAVHSAVPITRPLRIDCGRDRLVIRPDDNRVRSGKAVALAPKTEDSIEELVSIVWEHIDSWGSAGRGMYWRPILSVEVLPGGEGRFADLQTLLADSGLDVRKRGAITGAAQPSTTIPR